jgi:putative Mg2+ transporter-C (MgtC) family protein
MKDFFLSFASPQYWSVVVNLAVATILGAVIGIERESAGKVAGLRTHSMVALGSALFTVISIMLFARVPSISGTYGYDYHLVANILVGIGFIGAGAIMRKDEHVEGTTTAATLWMAAGIGMAAGFGFYREAIISTVLAYAILTGMWYIERRLRRSAHYRRRHPETALSSNSNQVEDHD